jgi:hypothetical protein
MSDALNLKDYRALDICDVVPAGCIGVLMTDDSFAPHLRCGEFAVVDTADKSTEFGELYVLTFGAGKPVRRVVQLRLRGFAGDPSGLWFAFALPGQGRRYATTLDGPLGRQHWPDKCVGRVVGVIPWTGRTA